MLNKKTDTFKNNLTAKTEQLSQDIDSLFASIQLPSPLKNACQYAMKNGGKRVRPLLVNSSFAAINNTEQSLVLSDMTRRAMLSVELLHAYSLVHDDMPCMDDDDLRRGHPTCHIAFDEATALLAGDLLQTLAFEVLTADITTFKPADKTIAAQLLLTFAPRARRMVSGQMLDINGENHSLNQQELQSIHQDKTGALIEASILMGAICAKANDTQLNALLKTAESLGLAFQVQDDILDVTANTDQLGKPAGSDQKLDKATYVKLLGVNAAQDYAKSLFLDAKSHLSSVIQDESELAHMVDWLWQRNH